ncbi:MAG: hypothetical protein AAF791_12990 [Bacteroidota bacterium]
MSRLFPVLALGLLLGACREGPDAPDPDGDGPPVVTSELPADMSAADDGVIQGAAPGFIGATAPETALVLDGGSVCYVYEQHVVRVEPIGTDGEPRGDDVRIAARTEGAIARDLCDSASRAVTDDTEADTFSGVEGDVLLLDRASGEFGRRIVALDLANGDAVVLDAPYEDPVEIEDGVLRFGSLVREATTMSGLKGADCPQGAEFVENGVVVGIVEMQRLDLGTREVAPEATLTCVPL